ncbi:MAG: PAAR-like domain-containing protein [Polyangiaceae bacterium]
MPKHIADGEAEFVVVNVTPDFCRVDGEVVPFDISQVLESEKSDYSPDFFARGSRVLKEGSIISGVEGNAGEGVASGVSQGEGHTVMIEGTDHFFVNGRRVCRHEDLCAMNVKVG